MYKSLPPGRRVSNTGKVYYERRANRTDMPGSMLGIGSLKKSLLENIQRDLSIKNHLLSKLDNIRNN